MHNNILNYFSLFQDPSMACKYYFNKHYGRLLCVNLNSFSVMNKFFENNKRHLYYLPRVPLNIGVDRVYSKSQEGATINNKHLFFSNFFYQLSIIKSKNQKKKFIVVSIYLSGQNGWKFRVMSHLA